MGRDQGRRDRTCHRAQDHLPVHPCAGIKRSYCCRICKIQKEAYQGAADRKAQKLQRCSPGIKAS